MRATRHNGRSGKHGVYNPKHNDRKFDIANSEHIDAEREKQNIYKKYPWSSRVVYSRITSRNCKTER